MTPTELTVGDLDTVIDLTEKAQEKCKARGDEFQEVTRILQFMRSMALSIQLSLKDRYEAIPPKEQESLKPILIGLQKTLDRTLRDAEAVASNPPASPFFFRVLGLDMHKTISPRDTVAMILMWMLTLNHWMQSLVRGAPEVDYTSTAGLASQTLTDDKKTKKPLQLAPQVEQIVQDWSRFNGKEAFKVRGIYAYGYKPSQSLLTQDDDPTDLSLQLKNGKISGTAEDSAGTSQIEGEINAELGTIRFIKSYGALNLWSQWEYNGRFTEWGVFGIWHIPGTPNSTWLGTGRFALWIDKDGAVPDIAEKLAEIEEKSVLGDKC